LQTIRSGYLIEAYGVKGSGDRTTAFVSKAVRIYDLDQTHNQQVTKIALVIFDELRVLHGYGAGERRLLEIASRLHDIGWSLDRSGQHHKRSCDLIRELDVPGLSKQDRLICALIARYHRKALPDAARHRRFATLDGRHREMVEWLAGILRVADGLDCTHSSLVKRLTCKLKNDTFQIHLEVKGDCRRELERASQKQDLLTKKAQRNIDYRC
jgi:exopolyphosphatase/guanosine-5'-triphosphate,3'-diphosphate pyrophosphatase